MATLISTDGSKRQVTPANGTDFTLEELYKLLECDMVQMIYLADPNQTMWMDEKAKLHPNPKPVNIVATQLLHEAGGMPDDHILGPVLVCSNGEVR